MPLSPRGSSSLIFWGGKSAEIGLHRKIAQFPHMGLRPSFGHSLVLGRNLRFWTNRFQRFLNAAAMGSSELNGPGRLHLPDHQGRDHQYEEADEKSPAIHHYQMPPLQPADRL